VGGRVRGRRNLLGRLLAGLLVLLGIAVAIPINVVSGYFPAAATGYRPLWIGLSSVGAVVIIALTLLTNRLSGRGAAVVLFQAPPVSGWVDRAELSELVSALTTERGPAVALTTGLVGAGGFGKTMLAARACADRAVRKRFRNGILWVTVGRDLSGTALAARITDLISVLGREAPTLTGPEQAGQALSTALAERGRTLLVVDDVWSADQLQAFAAVVQTGHLLVTTRRPVVLADLQAYRIKVDAVTGAVAHRLVTRGLPSMAGRWERELLELTGGWPLLLSLVNQRLADDLRRPGGTIDVAARDAAARLRRAGPTALDVADSGSRRTAVAATIEYSLDGLRRSEQERFLELGIFAEDAEVPVDVVALVWRGTAGLSRAAAQALCERLDGLSLVSLAWVAEHRVIVIHDVIRDFALSHLGEARRTATHAALVSEARRLIGGGEAGQQDRAAIPADEPTPWWRLADTAGPGYLWENLTYHLRGAGRVSELDQACGDLRFLAVRLRVPGPAAVDAELALSMIPTAGRLRSAITQNAHLLVGIEPAAALITTFTSWLGHIPEVAEQMPGLSSSLHAWTAWPTWPLPDVPYELPGARIEALGTDGTERSWTLGGRLSALWPTGHSAATAVAISPDGTWLASAYFDGTARTWTPRGTLRAVLTGHQGWINAVAISPDGTWLATAGSDKTARTWDADGTPRAVLTGHQGWINAVAISPDGTWLATAGSDKTARTWDADGTPRAVLTGHQGTVTAVVISPDGTWLATGGADATVRTWTRDGSQHAVFAGHQSKVTAVVISPDGTWLATASTDRTVRTWDADGTPRAVLSDHQDTVTTVAISPDGTWLATASWDGTLRTWARNGTPRTLLHDKPTIGRTMTIAPDGTWLATASGESTVVRRAEISQHNADSDRHPIAAYASAVWAMAISPDGTWLATASSDKTARTWDADGTPRTTLTGHQGTVTAVAISPDGTWLATASWDGTTRTWDADGTPRAVFAGHQSRVSSIAISPDGTWLATTAWDGTTRIWTANGVLRATLTGHRDLLRSVTISLDGTWLATGGNDGTVRIWASAADGKEVQSITAIRVEGIVSACAWFPRDTDICIASQNGISRYSLRPPP
jgi:WD40 repeat protein